MFVTRKQTELISECALYTSMLHDRTQQFVNRLGWPLSVDSEGLERDAYDDDFTTYCIVINNGRHQASLRICPAELGSMTEHHFPMLWQENLKSSFEITRLCSSPYTILNKRSEYVSDLLLGLCRYGLQNNLNSLFGVVFPSTMRAIQRAGWSAEVLNRHDLTEGTFLLARWTPSELTAWNIQEIAATRGEAGRQPVEALRKLVA